MSKQVTPLPATPPVGSVFEPLSVDLFAGAGGDARERLVGGHPARREGHMAGHRLRRRPRLIPLGRVPERRPRVNPLEKEMAHAERAAWDALGRYKFWMFGYWAAVWVHLNRIGGFKRANPFRAVVKVAREVPRDPRN